MSGYSSEPNPFVGSMGGSKQLAPIPQKVKKSEAAPTLKKKKKKVENEE